MLLSGFGFGHIRRYAPFRPHPQRLALHPFCKVKTILQARLWDCWLLQQSHSEEWLLQTLWLCILYSIASLVQVISSIHGSKATHPIANDTLFVSAICTLIEPLFLQLDCEKGLFVVSCQRKAMHSEARKPSLCFLRKNSSNLALALEKELIINTM